MTKKIKIETGFPLLLSLLGFVAVVYHGKINKIISLLSTLTWFKEWYLYFEKVYGKLLLRWIIDNENKYNVSHGVLRSIYNNMQMMVLFVQSQWPLYASYASYNEDKTYWKVIKWDAYDGKRLIMFDNTNIIIRQPSDAEAQRSTYPLYYSGNAGKAAVYIQPCGWIGSHEVWTGGVSDTAYMQLGQVFEALSNYLLTSTYKDNNTQYISFTIVLDMGYRVVLDAYQNVGHLVLQPIFAQSDWQFSTVQTLISSAVATNRAGNKQAVRYLEKREYIKKGLLTNKSTVRMCDT
jgi:hypothetical protein